MPVRPSSPKVVDPVELERAVTAYVTAERAMYRRSAKQEKAGDKMDRAVGENAEPAIAAFEVAEARLCDVEDALIKAGNDLIALLEKTPTQAAAVNGVIVLIEPAWRITPTKMDGKRVVCRTGAPVIETRTAAARAS